MAQAESTSKQCSDCQRSHDNAKGRLNARIAQLEQELDSLRAEVKQLRVLCSGTGKTLIKAAQAGEGSDE